jgi:hypothetical protein
MTSPVRFTPVIAFLSLGALSFAEKPAKPKPAQAADAVSKPGNSGWPAPDEVVAAMKKATSAMRSISFVGGYAWKWPVNLSEAKGENRSAPALIMLQPPGTPAVGEAMLAAYTATGDRLFLQGAKEAAQALMWCQMATGGWTGDFDFDPRKARDFHYRRDIEAGDLDPGKRHGISTLDDRKTQSAIRFLLDLAHDEAGKNDPALRASLKFALDGLLAAQAPNGGWPQQYRGAADASAPVVKAKINPQWPRVWPAVNYIDFYTLNDGNIYWVVKLLLQAHELEKDPRYLAAAKKAGEFLLVARLPDPQPVWAQQYNREMEPVWARKFEPPAASSIESFGALKALVDLWVATGETKWLEPVKPALAWLAKVKLPDGRWARFYELGTDKPIYTKAGTYEFTYDDSDLPTHYGFKIDANLQEDLDGLTAVIARGREAILRERAEVDPPKKWTSRAKSLVAKVQTALRDQSKEGWWLKDEMIDAGLFVKNLNAMSAYIDAAKKGGAIFDEQRKATLTEPKPAAK